MPVFKPASAKEISQKAKIDVKRALSSSDPFVSLSYLGALISGLCNRVFEFYLSLDDVEKEGNPATAVRNLVRWASVWKVTRLTGAPASGAFFVNTGIGNLGRVVPVNTRFVSSSGGVYVSSAAATVGFVSLSISSITQTGGVATVTTTGAHGLASNAVFSLSGIDQAGYNVVNASITVTAADKFTYEVDAATVSPATWTTPVAIVIGVLIPVVSEGVGSEYDLDADTPLSFESPLSGLEATGNVTFEGVIDGVDVETDDELRARMLSRIQNPITPFNEANIDAVAKQEPGVTRVFVQPKTPAIGQVTVYFMRDNDVSPIPSAGDVANVRARILAFRPAHVADADVIVSAPTAVPSNFTFTALSPDTASMRAAIIAQLTEFFRKKTEVGTNVVEEAFSAAIFNTVDQTTGQAVISFTLSAPSGDISVGTGEIATLGAVTFS